MKRFLGILICVFAFSGCDDGDLIVDTIDFSEVTTSTCSENNLIFKLKESEALILNIPEETFTDNPTAANDPIELDVNGTNQVVYNFYDGKVSTEKICNLLPPATPNVKDQWEASSGIIQITTTAVKKLDETNNSTRITGYNNNITFKNITFTKPDGTTQFYETFPFGDYLKTADPLPFGFNGLLNICSSNQVYDFTESESFTLNIDPTLIANEVTPVGSPRTGVIGLVKNKLVYRLFNGVVPPSYFCQPTDPLLPTVNQTWLGKEGGIIEVTTTTSGPNTFKHTIIFKNVTLEKDTNNFQLGNSYKYGELQTVK
ncbi:hypothetical protein [Flavobacterium sp. A45]|uniref:hypothetical protein n=1 Tax=Flavobacterium sp. A45 TaxID=1945862 RepID=UPI0009861613|nr:hypothetical protein [Flavobacterium sp. A45]OOG78607.1 hypothetical protein B0E44_00650 [Flavobacterium sp. A45]